MSPGLLVMVSRRIDYAGLDTGIASSPEVYIHWVPWAWGLMQIFVSADFHLADIQGPPEGCTLLSSDLLKADD